MFQIVCSQESGEPSSARVHSVETSSVWLAKREKLLAVGNRRPNSTRCISSGNAFTWKRLDQPLPCHTKNRFSRNECGQRRHSQPSSHSTLQSVTECHWGINLMTAAQMACGLWSSQWREWTKLKVINREFKKNPSQSRGSLYQRKATTERHFRVRVAFTIRLSNTRPGNAGRNPLALMTDY